MNHAFMANDTHLEESAKQLFFWSWLWSDSATGSSATDGSFDLGVGKTFRIGDFPSLDQSAHVYLYWPPGPFLATQYDKESGGAGFEAIVKGNKKLQNTSAPTASNIAQQTNKTWFPFFHIGRASHDLVIVDDRQGKSWFSRILL